MAEEEKMPEPEYELHVEMTLCRDGAVVANLGRGYVLQNLGDAIPTTCAEAGKTMAHFIEGVEKLRS